MNNNNNLGVHYSLKPFSFQPAMRQQTATHSLLVHAAVDMLEQPTIFLCPSFEPRVWMQLTAVFGLQSHMCITSVFKSCGHVPPTRNPMGLHSYCFSS